MFVDKKKAAEVRVELLDANAGAGKTWYDALQSKVERRFGALNFIASYVWSKTLSQMTYRQIFRMFSSRPFSAASPSS